MGQIMQTKLTLRLDAELIALAKEHASHEKRSLSRLIADYFRGLAAQQKALHAQSLPPLTTALKGALKTAKALSKDDYHRFLEEKYQ
jgi:hypothetical protein